MHVGETISSKPLVLTNGTNPTLQDFRGKWLVLYFYPKDSTPGCTLEGQDFQRLSSQFQSLNTVILGVSRDTLKSHENFRCKQQYSFDLVSDQEESLCQYFDVIKMKSMYGKVVRGIERSTFLIDPEGKLCKEWRKVTVKGHAEEVLKQVRQFQENFS
jgi:peroxiredoxin Q/BCP